MTLAVCCFSQTISKPRIIKDSSGVKMYAFDEKQVDILIKGLIKYKDGQKMVNELNKQLLLFKQKNTLFSQTNDTLKSNIKKCLEITINQKNEISIKEAVITDLNKNIEDYKQIIKNKTSEVDIYVQKVKKKNRLITKLIVTNAITGGLLIWIFIKNNE